MSYVINPLEIEFKDFEEIGILVLASTRTF